MAAFVCAWLEAFESRPSVRGKRWG
ncbi:hypothetical protein AM469_006471, partial [Pseudomonas aeruginosa]